MASSDLSLPVPLRALTTRLRQGLTALTHRRASDTLPPPYRHALPEPVVAAWERLAPYDRRHLLAVARDLERAGATEILVLAGLLHDIGKAGGVRVADRAAHVLLSRVAPGLHRRLAHRGRSTRLLRGLHLLMHHPERGAELLDAAGMPEELVWLVRHHESPQPHPWLRDLQAADHRH